MKVKVSHSIINTLTTLKGKWLLSSDNTIQVIRDFQYVRETEEPKEPKKGYFVRKKDMPQEPKECLYVTSLTLEGYHPSGKFVGTYYEDHCKQILKTYHYQSYWYELRKAWLHLEEQIEAYKASEKEAEKKLKAEEKTEPKEEPEYLKEVMSLLREGKPMKALQVYKNGTGKSLKESKDFITILREEIKAESKAEPDYMGAVKALVESGNRISAIKAYKDGSKKSLEESRNFINELENK